MHSFLTCFRNVDFDVFALRSFLTRLISNSFQGYVGPVNELRRPQYLATGNPPIVSAFGDTVWGGGAVLIISKNLPLKGKFFEMVSWGGLGGLCPPQESPLPVPCPQGGSGGLRPPGISVTRALPLQRPCLAPVPCPQFFFGRNIFRPKIFRPKKFRPKKLSAENIFDRIFFVRSSVRPPVRRPSVVRPSVRKAVGKY